MSVPSSSTWPDDGVSRPASRPSRVDLPEPEAPTRASVSAGCTVKSTSCRIVSSPLASITRLESPRTSIAGLTAPPCPAPTFAASGISRMLASLLRKWTFIAVAVFASAASGSAYSAPKTVLVVGDSLSAEYGLARGSGWVALLEQRLKRENIDARIVNASISGETTSGGRTRLPALLQQHKPDVVVLELGANDGLRGLPVPAAMDNLRTMIQLAQQNRARVLLVGMRMPPNYGRAYTERFAGMYKDLAGTYKVPLVPFMLDGVAQDPANFQADRMHPLASAHPTILNNIWPQFAPLVKR
ncbi:MAG: arylesterase [Massilia sp.]|nr:arylesterase [Massilia sp.]